MPCYYFDTPPLPHFYICGEQIINKDESHAARSNIGVFDLLIVLEGKLFIGEADRQWELKPWDMLILRPDAHHYSTAPSSEKTRFFWLHFQAGSRWFEVEEQSQEETLPLELSRYQHFGNTYSLYIPKHWSIKNKDDVKREMSLLLTLNNKTSMTNGWEQQSAFQRLIRIVFQETQEMSASTSQLLIERVTEYLRNNYKDSITNEALAEEFHFHPVYITRSMQKHQGCTPLQYLMKVRIEQAKLLLINTDGSIADIASEVGFDSNTYFTRCFQKAENKTPREYRNQFRA
ncbi:putative HTH-type transcriptional regulator YisR [Paenibacillus sp. CCS19]|uniref:helix-turn-helix transcriptional regulator n=1 Tax=Paenibacillus sp. CCS19 TaxID=3158387 RepID=UPI00256905A5|nr:AraC family transcriptional regulator [Paenibacillus cellulosilyticus]GMK37284.1 putative HTH-type transcriptional regulator YisR [Paenibacillus cellulosilyticus]